MATSSQSEESYEVFLSFRGLETRHAIISHLYKALDSRGINTFKDDEKLKQGESVSPALIKAIEKSRIAIIVFTPDFASSRWCLEEVAKIMECKKTNNLVVLPVFYYVDPNEVRNPRYEYGDAFRKHKEKHREKLEEVKKWEKALADAGSLYGSEFNVWVVAKETTLQLESREFKVKKNFRKGTTIQRGGKFQTEADLVESIVREIWIQLDPTPLKVADFPVGIDSRVDELIAKLDMKSREETRTIVLWSMGGMGKTTLAKALYNTIFKDFEGSAYVDDIKGTLQETEKMVRLQKNLLQQMLMIKEISINSDAAGSNLIGKRLDGKRVLLILDGVDDICQIKGLAGERNQFGRGSKIIITTTNKALLGGNGVLSHTVQPLKNAEAREFFMKHASSNGYKIVNGDFIRRALRCTHGHPLALRTLGRAFAASKANEWESKLNDFAESSEQSIDEVLRKSHDALDYKKKPIFLHIACFFNGWSRRYVEAVLKNCELSEETGVNDLIGRSLIMEENGILKVHDLIEKMGKNIVDREFDRDAAKSSRLWRLGDVRKVLSGDEGTAEVEAIVLAPPKPEKINICSEAFKKLKKLRFLIMINIVTDFRGPICLPDQLRWFEWPECPAPTLQLASPDKLRVLRVSRLHSTTCLSRHPDSTGHAQTPF